MQPILLLLLSLAASAAEPFAVQVSGNPKAPALLFIPGLSSSSDVWKSSVDKFCPSAKAKFSCHVFTLPGFAGQPRLGDGPFLATVKDSIAAYMQTNKLAQPTLIGHSLGGHMALWLASEQPARIGKLVVVDSLPHLGALMNEDPAALRKQAEGMRLMITAQTQEQYNAYLKNSKMLDTLVGPAGLPEVMKWSLASDPVAVGNAMFDLYTTDLREAIAKIASPTLVLSSWVAYKDVSTREASLALVEKQYAALKSKTILVSDTAKHFIMLDEPAWFLASVEKFLAAQPLQ